MHLLDIGLGQPLRILAVFVTGPIQDNSTGTDHLFLLDDGALAVVLREAKHVLPGGSLLIAEAHSNRHIRVAAGGERSQLGNASTLQHCLLKSASNRDDVMEKPKYIKQIRLA